MTKLLSDLLETDELQFKQSINNLEHSAAFSSQDIRFSESILRQVDNKIRLLDLDPRDTTNHELYLSLQNKIKHDDDILSQSLRTIAAKYISAEGNIHQAIIYVVKRQVRNLKIFAVKNAKVKAFLISNPPNKVLKILNYRTTSSLLKHEPVGLVLILAKQIETKSWLKKYDYYLTTLNSQDFEFKTINVITFDKIKYKRVVNLLEKQHKTVFASLELSTILVLPVDKHLRDVPGLTTASLCFAFKYVNDIIVSSNYLQLNQVSSRFGFKVARSYTTQPSIRLNVFNQDVSWETFERFFSYIDYNLNKFFLEYINLEELKGWQQIENQLIQVEPKLSFWLNSDYLARKINHEVHVSFNILDNAINLCNQRSYPSHSFIFYKTALWQELMLRYFRPELIGEALNRELASNLATTE